MSNSSLSIYSDIGKLRRVLLHKPGSELENLTPKFMQKLLFDDIPFLEKARQEHDAFAKILMDNGVEVVYVENLLAEILLDNSVKEKFLEEYLTEARVFGKVKEKLFSYYMDFKDNYKLVDKLIAGIRVDEFDVNRKKSLADMVNAYPFIIDPMPNLYFTRDTFAVVGKGITINKMATAARNRETLISKYIFKYHKDFKDGVPKYYDRENNYNIEGGDELVLSDEVIAIGISERTSPEAIEQFANNIFKSDESFKVILGFQIPFKRAFMHLDTVFTMVDVNKFTIHPEAERELILYRLEMIDDELSITKEELQLEDILKKYLHLDNIEIIRCGDAKWIDADREQWNDGSNTLAIAPGEVIVYDRNTITNSLLEQSGIKIHVMPSSELSRGRGGPRCMSMPLNREKI